MRTTGLRAASVLGSILILSGCQARSPVLVALDDGDEALAALLATGTDPNAVDTDRETALHRAVIRGDARSVRILLEYGARSDSRDGDESTPLFVASRLGRTECAYALLTAGADPNARSGPTAEAPLHGAAGSPEVVRLLLERGADPNASNTWGETALHAASRFDPARAGASAELLIGHGADPEARDVRGYTPLHDAAARDNLAVVEVYRARGRDLSTRAIEGATPLDVAIAEGAVRAADLLYRSGARPAMTSSFLPPLHRAAKLDDRDGARLLLAFGARPADVFEGKTPSDVARENGSDDVLVLLGHAPDRRQ